MATITKINNSIVIQTNNSTQPSIIAKWDDARVTYGSDHVTLVVDGKGYRFATWATSTYGELTEVNGVDVSAFDNVDIAALISSSVITDDRFSGTPVIIDDTTMVEGQFTAIQILEDAEFDVSDSAATIEVDGNGDAIDMSGYATVVYPAGGTPIYGKFTQIQLVSGVVKAYSNL